MYAHLLSKVSQQFPEWKTATLQNTLLMVALLLSEKTCNLWKLKAGVGRQLGNTKTLSTSHYQRIKRWLAWGQQHPRAWTLLVKAAASLLTTHCQCLIIDGTSWQRNGLTFHFLTLSVIYRGVSIPLWWIDLDQLGQSSQWHRRLLIRSALKGLHLRGKILLGDREYVGKEWLELLQQVGIEVVIRLRTTDYRAAIEQAGRPIADLEKKARRYRGMRCWQEFTFLGQPYRFVVVAYRERNGKMAYLRLLTSLDAERAVDCYSQRYKIETMFKNLKSNGFELESLNVACCRKINWLMATLVVAYTLAVVYGLSDFGWRVKVKKHGRPAIGVFRWGLDKWQNHLRDLGSFLRELQPYLAHWLYVKPPYREVRTSCCKSAYYVPIPVNVP